MTDISNAQRAAFRTKIAALVKVTPRGFVINDEILATLRGRIIKSTLLRKLFDGTVLVCDSQNGVTARNGTACESCLHPLCRPQLRVHLHDGNVAHIIDLAQTSARNLFRIHDDLARSDLHLRDVVVELTVADHATWGEVRFKPH